MTVTPAQSEHLAKSLQRETNAEVYFGPYERALYSSDASMYQIVPLGVVVPRSVADVVRTVQLTAEAGVPLIPRGAGTSLSGQSIGAGVILDFSKYLNRIVEIDRERMTARVEPGVVLDHLNAAAAKHGLQFGPDVATSSRANLGGMIGNNSAGSRSVLHGKTVDHVIALDAVLADGTQETFAPLAPEQLAREQGRHDMVGHLYREIPRIVAENREEILARFPAVLRRVSGYNLDRFVPECLARIAEPANVERVRAREAARYPGGTFNLSRLIVGAEGTLATVTGALVHLLPVAAHRSMLVLEFDDLADAVAAVAPTLALRPSAIELFDGMIVRMARRSLEYRNYLDFVQGDPETLLLVEFSGETADGVSRQLRRLEDQLRGHHGLRHQLVTHDRAVCDHIWACRKAALPLLMGIPGERKPIAFVEDTAVDPARLSDFVARFRDILARAGTHGAFYGHASVGCLHIRPLIDTKSADDLARMRQILDEVSDLVLEFRGAMSGEHGDGLARSFLNEKLFGPQIYRAFCEVKGAFDPANRLNPGKVVHGPDPAANLRQAPGHRPLAPATTFDFSAQGGFAQAAELCNGSGLCRKTRTGTMCPSFMATGDEEHSTRGRANALRLVLSGVLPPAELTGARLHQTFDLCLQCKGCKAECPSNVDVAKLKSEFLSQYHAERGAPLSVRMMGRVATLNRLGSALAPLSNWIGGAPFSGWLAEKLLGIDRRRPLPRFERQDFRSWFRVRGTTSQSSVEAPRGKIVLFDDCLNNYCEPGVLRAAVDVLVAAGYDVQLAGIRCCGRPLISKGLLTEARALAAHNVERLHGWVAQNVPIVGCEPSCVSALVDDYVDLLPGNERAAQLAAKTEFIDAHLVRARAIPPLVGVSQQVLLHGHCHQKALVGVADTRRALEALPEAEVSVVDSGCCGMAGSFGYEHYDLSMKIGGRVLFPAVEAHGGVVVAPGFSCRHQIEHGTGRRAQHPIELLAAHLKQDR
ncbi:MAG: FAD-binding protein [Pirellulales bacterium]|nr:FAD-binding protein [Pirellulales bacterium]